VSRRIDVSCRAATRPAIRRISNATSAYDTYNAEGRLRCALSRTTAAYVEYVRYFYDSKGTLPWGPGVPMLLERQGVARRDDAPAALLIQGPSCFQAERFTVAELIKRSSSGEDGSCAAVRRRPRGGPIIAKAVPELLPIGNA